MKYNTVFINDPFTMVYEAFGNLYPDKHCICQWAPKIRADEDGSPVLGLTNFGEDGEINVYISSSLKVEDAMDILAHELAHVAVGIDHDHDEVWEKAYDDIFDEYNRIGDAMFPEEKA